MADLDSAMRPGSAAEIRIEVAKNFTVLAARSGDRDDIRGQQLLCVEALDDMPLFAIQQACLDFRKGIIGDGKWAPSPADIRRRAFVLAKPFLAERDDLGGVLETGPARTAISAKPGAAQRMRDIVKGIAKEASAFPPPKEVRDMRTELQRRQAVVDRLADTRYAEMPLGISDDLRRQLTSGAS